MRHLHVMTDYFAFPLWERTPGATVGSVDPASLPISERLREGLLLWAEEYETKTLEEQSSREWQDRGRELAQALQRELGERYLITYQA